MKKFLLALCTAALALASCSKTEPSTLDNAKTFSDSINIALGQYLGALANAELAKHPEIDTTEAFKGIYYIMESDTADHARFHGIDMGMNVLNSYYSFACQETVDLNVFLNNFESEFLGVTSEATSGDFIGKINQIFAEIEARNEIRNKGGYVAQLSQVGIDSLSICLGKYYGSMGREVRISYLPKDIDSLALMKYIRQVCAIDTANKSYATGLTIGQNTYNYFYDQAQRAGGSRTQFISAFKRTLEAEDVSEAELATMKEILDPLTFRSIKMQQQAAEKEIFNTRPAIENRILGDAVAEKLLRNPEFAPIGNDGIMMRSIKKGDGKILSPDSEVRIDVAAHRIDTKQEVYSRLAVRMFVGNPRDEMLINLLPLMQMGETAEFFVPYTKAYGILGMERRNVGPCESLFVTITVKPVE